MPLSVIDTKPKRIVIDARRSSRRLPSYIRKALNLSQPGDLVEILLLQPVSQSILEVNVDGRGFHVIRMNHEPDDVYSYLLERV